DDLAEPSAALRRVDAVRIRRRRLHVIDLPAGEVRAGDLPVLALAVGGEDEGAFLGAGQDADARHGGRLRTVDIDTIDDGRRQSTTVDDSHPTSTKVN